jgi:hypothetical protein
MLGFTLIRTFETGLLTTFQVGQILNSEYPLSALRGIIFHNHEHIGDIYVFCRTQHGLPREHDL